LTQAPNGAAAPMQAPGAPQAAKPRAKANIYTVMAFFSLLCLGAAIGYVLARSAELFGSVGELFNMPETAGWITSIL